MRFPRASGVLLHPSSLPCAFGIGDFGPAAYEFVDFLVEARQTYWQVLPLGPTGYGDSPYQSFSAFAGNTLLISPEKLVEDGLLSRKDLVSKQTFEPGRVDYGGVYTWKNKILATAFSNFRNGAGARDDFGEFSRDNASWLDDYALYRAAKASQGQRPWYEWESSLKLHDAGVISAAREKLQEQIEAERFYQFLFFRQWMELKEYAEKGGVKIVGDVPIFVALDSADVWCNQDKFKLDADGLPKVVAGVPPDYFSKTGQLWGNPIYDWKAMGTDGFRWWVERVKHSLKIVDVLRIDHFRGFAAAWEVPGGDETAENGSWVNVPGKELFSALKDELGTLPFWAEDLGVVTPDVVELRDEFGLPGMHILQYAFGGDARNLDLPHNYVNNCVAYTGTHDNDTTVGWWSSQVDTESAGEADVHDFCLRYLNATGDEINWDLIRAAWASVADTAVAPMQDLLGLGSEARMNVPASSSGNWQWRYKDGDITEALASRLGSLTETYGRNSDRSS
jgi:4-alpha-glucanotransferase